MKLALAGVVSGVVDVEENDGGDGDAVHQTGRGHQSDEPAFAVSLFVVSAKRKDSLLGP